MARKRTRKPNGAVEMQAAEYWANAHPGLAMGTLAVLGNYTGEQRAEFLTNVVGLPVADAPDFVDMLPDPATPDTGDADTGDAGEAPAKPTVTVNRSYFDINADTPWRVDEDERDVTPDEWDTEDGYGTPALMAVRILRDSLGLWGRDCASATSADGSFPGGRVWYSDPDAYVNRATGEREEISAHLNGFSEADQKLIYELVTLPPAEFRERFASVRTATAQTQTTHVPCDRGMRAEPMFPIGATIIVNRREAVVDARVVDHGRQRVEYRIFMLDTRTEATIPAAAYPLAVDVPACSCCGASRIRVVPVLRSGKRTGRYVCAPCAAYGCTFGPVFRDGADA